MAPEGVEVIHTGMLHGDEEKADAYSASDVFVLPTRAETTGLVLLESMACGTPVVAFGVGGVPEAVRAGETGELAEPENAKDLALKVISLLLAEPERRQRMSDAARAWVVDNYSLPLCAERHVALYERLASGQLERSRS